MFIMWRLFCVTVTQILVSHLFLHLWLCNFTWSFLMLGNSSFSFQSLLLKVSNYFFLFSYCVPYFLVFLFCFCLFIYVNFLFFFFPGLFSRFHLLFFLCFLLIIWTSRGLLWILHLTPYRSSLFLSTLLEHCWFLLVVSVSFSFCNHCDFV